MGGLDPSAVEIMNKPAYAAGQWAIAVRDLDSGQQIIELDNSALIEPGSVTKTYAAAAAWLTFGPDSTVVTPVKRTGDVVDGALGGDLILVGKEDLTMGGRTKADGSVDFANLDHNDANSIPGATLTPGDPLTGLNDLAAQIKAAGITSVTGDVIVDDRLWDPHVLPTNGPVTPIIINQNLIDFTGTPTSPGQVAAVKMTPAVAPWTVTTEVRTVAAGQPTSTSVSSPAPGRLVLTGTIAADAAPTVNTLGCSVSRSAIRAISSITAAIFTARSAGKPACAVNRSICCTWVCSSASKVMAVVGSPGSGSALPKNCSTWRAPPYWVLPR